MMKKKQWIGCLILMICSFFYDGKNHYQKEKDVSSKSYVILEGEFLYTGKYEFEETLNVKQLIDEIGVSSSANLQALNMEYIIKDESKLYLPKKTKQMISLNHASINQLMTLKGVGEKTAQKIIDYRNAHEFECLEDLMNVSGIGEKTFMKLRDFLCL